MFTALKFIIKFIVSVVVLAALAAVGVALFVDPNNFKPQITEFVSKNTGYQIELKGDINWSFWPNLALEVNDVQYQELTIQKALVSADLSQLIKGNIIVNDIAIYVPDLRQADQVILKNIVLQSSNLQLAKNNITTNISLSFESIDNIASSITGKIKLANNLLHAPLSAKLGTNKNNLQLKLDFDLKKSVLNIVLNGKQLELGKIWQAFSQPSMIVGTADLNANLTSQGKTAAELKQHLNGTTNIVISNGQLQNININDYASLALGAVSGLSNLLENEKLQKMQDSFNNSSKTKFAKIKASCNINDGIIKNQDLLLLSKKYKVTGHGVINLPNNLIVYQAQIKLLEHKKLKNIAIPVKIRGNLDAPTVQTDNHAFANNVIQALQKDKLKSFTNKLLRKFSIN